MAVTGRLYGSLFLASFAEEHSLLADAIRAMITTSGYTPLQDTNDYKNDVTNEVTGTGYTAAGELVLNDTLTYTAGTNVTKYDGDDVVWASSTITGRTGVLYNATGGGSDATRGLIGYQESSVDITSTGGNWQITWASTGIFTIVTA